MVLDLSLSALLFWAAGMSKAGNRSLFLRLRLVFAAEPELRFAGYLLTKRAKLSHHGPIRWREPRDPLSPFLPSTQTVFQNNNTKITFTKPKENWECWEIVSDVWEALLPRPTGTLSISTGCTMFAWHIQSIKTSNKSITESQLPKSLEPQQTLQPEENSSVDIR